jgi:phage gp36-like protein
MALYATEQDLDRKFSPTEITLIADRNADGIRDADKITEALAAATRLINSKIAHRLPDPLTEDDAEALKDMACHIARYELYEDLPPEHVRTRYEDTLKMLDLIAAGKQGLGKSQGTQPAATIAESSVEMVSTRTGQWGWGDF